MTEPDGNTYLLVTKILEDPQYMNGPYVRTVQFKKATDAAGGIRRPVQRAEHGSRKPCDSVVSMTDRLGLVDGAVVRDVTAALDVLPTGTYPFPQHDLLVANLDGRRDARAGSWRGAPALRARQR